MKMEAAGGIVLVLAARLWPWSWPIPAITRIIKLAEHLPSIWVLAIWTLHKSVSHWINDGLMVLFFLVVGLELKREIVEGQFADRANITLPVIGAIGGMAVPMLIYAGFELG